jgi:outer membrane protein assembly factor BamE (lipoprotein component of BamABCDE complex)
MRAAFLLPLVLAFGCAPVTPVHTIGTGRFVSDEAIAAVKVCETRGEDVLASFGTPSGSGRDDDFTTYQWISMASARVPTGAVVKSQTIGVWVDGSGRVARIVVNPTSMPTKPDACPTTPTAKAASPQDAKANKSKAKAR